MSAIQELMMPVPPLKYSLTGMMEQLTEFPQLPPGPDYLRLQPAIYIHPVGINVITGRDQALL